MMKLPILWLKEFIDIDLEGGRLLEFAERMTMSGSKVEKIHRFGHEITGVIAGRVEQLLPHPNADKLLIARVNVGAPELKQIVTGADNLKEGDYIPVAVHGANLANGLKIKKGKIRGEVSDGMLVSIEEMGYSRAEFPEAPENGIYVFDKPQELGADARPLLGLLDDVIEFEITTNRPDCFSIVGLVREASAAYNYQLSINNYQSNVEKAAPIEVEIANPELCPRYIAAVVENVRIAPSPLWLRSRLIACGLRPVNNIVDITNYVMLEYGQPMHAFDIRAIEGGKIIVRNAAKGEKITTLDGIERDLSEDMLLIADPVKAVGIAGIKGGEFSKILDDTTTILFESANFYGPNIRLSSKELGLRTDSSGRYEKGLDPTLAETCILRALELVELLDCGDIVPGLTDCYPMRRDTRELKFDPQRINARLGIDLRPAQIAEILECLGISVAKNVATIPTFRYDITTWEDLSEEVARLYGYDNIPTVVASSANVGVKNSAQIMEARLVDIMVALGFSQALTYAFESPKVFDKLLIPENFELRNTVRILNPLGEDTSIMRTTPLNSMLTALSTNYNRRNPTARLFELVKVYTPNENPQELPAETQKLVVGGYGDMDFYDIKGVLEAVTKAFGVESNFEPPFFDVLPYMHPGQVACATFECGAPLAFCGKIHPKVAENYEIDRPAFVGVLNFDKLCENAVLSRDYSPLPRYPQISRDLAVVVKNDIRHGQIAAKIKEAGGKYLRALKLFDIYAGKTLPEGHKSMAYNLIFRADDRTLEDKDATKATEKILAALGEAFDAQLRQ
ncbi:MAG: phenylalanine--tRNA ligase subunit beta [Clostridiales bacterium]|jgi:phenylalanyl-tRNA synthetase beta chain|nr:phenylalanine--tRNA ligase subunit beta [Clostridiales bacterium]